ncbi:hypothetical protein CI610_03726 [invertebrate metagenome]|uniref:Uncharacterized protein n=1 Tax=invertebrate metagenome TaxID=1711999 RepID=A0A2H9T2A9_9ZZZZ
MTLPSTSFTCQLMCLSLTIDNLYGLFLFPPSTLENICMRGLNPLQTVYVSSYAISLLECMNYLYEESNGLHKNSCYLVFLSLVILWTISMGKPRPSSNLTLVNSTFFGHSMDYFYETANTIFKPHVS